MKSHSIGTVPRNTAMLMRQACFGRMDLGMGFLRPGFLRSLWGCSYGRSNREQTSWEPALGKGDRCTPVLHITLTGLGSTQQGHSAEAGPHEGWSRAWRQNVLFNSIYTLFSVGFPG